MKLVRGVSFQMLAQAITLAAGLGALPLLTRHLGLSGYGVFVTVMAFCALLSAVSDLGLGATTVREVASGRVPDGVGVASAAGVRALNAIWVVLGGIAIALAMGQPAAVVVGIAAAAGYVLLTGLAAVGPNVVLQVRGRFGWVAVAAAVQASVWLIGVAVVVLADLDSAGAIGALTVAALAGLAVSGWAAQRMLVTPLAFDGRIAAALVRQGVSLGLASLLAVAYYRVDAILLAALAGTTAAGVYGAAYRFLDQGRVMASFIGIAGHAAVARAASDMVAFRSSVAHMVRLAALCGALLTIGLFVLAEPLTNLLFGARFSDTPPLLRVLSLAVLPMFLNNVIPYAMIAQRRQAVYIWINLGALVANLGGNLLLIPRFGPLASAWLTVLTECVVLCASLIAVWSVLRFVPGLGLYRSHPLEAQA